MLRLRGLSKISTWWHAVGNNQPPDGGSLLYPQEKEPEEGSKGSEPELGLCWSAFFALSPYFLSMGSSREFARVDIYISLSLPGKPKEIRYKLKKEK
jgi:hypothetical protein